MELYDTLSDLLAEARGKEREICFIDGENDESIVKFGALWDRALALLGSLQAGGMQPGDELIIFSKSNESFVVAFWAAVLGGIVPVPVAVGISDEHRLKLFRIVSQLEKATLFTEKDLLERLLEFSRKRELDDITTLLESRTALMSDVDASSNGNIFKSAPDDIAFIQYSSGSTSDPKGVVLTHRNLCTNIRAIVEATHWNEHDQSLSWMPLTHDMGLIGYHLSVLGIGMNHALMDTSVFVRRPLLWMSKTNELRATQLCSPNFGYKHFLKLFQRKGMADLDLSCVKLILNGAEPISWELCEEFLAALAPHGLQRTAMYPVYGLAEATVGVSLSVPGSEYSRITVDRHSLRIGDTYRSVDPDDDAAVSFVTVGILIGYHLSVLGIGMNHALMDTSVFVRRPLLWMSKTNELRATQLCSPNFGYKHFLKLFQRKGMADLDLSCVKLILNGAEPISWELCEEFLAALAPHGLQRTAMYPVYGLAEATVGVSLSVPGSEYSRITVDRHSLRIGDTYRSVDPDDDAAVSFVTVGNAIRDVRIRIADDSDQVLDAAVIGNIQLSGDSITKRIYGDTAATTELFTEDGWLRTGEQLC